MIEFKSYLSDGKKSIAMCDHGWKSARDSFLEDHKQSVFMETKNEYGEAFAIAIYQDIPFGLLLNSDAEDVPYPIVNGCAIGGITCSLAETQIIEAQWSRVVGSRPPYHGNAECQIGQKVTYITNDVCPICLQKKTEWDNHHAIYACEGGWKTAENMIRICRDCHALTTAGSLESINTIDRAAIYHQQAIHGFSFFPRGNGQGRYKDRRYLKHHPDFDRILQQWDDLAEGDKEKQEDFFKARSWNSYLFWRAMAMKQVSWVSYDQFVLGPNREWCKEYEKQKLQSS